MIKRTAGPLLLALWLVACTGGQATQSPDSVVSPQAVQVPPSTDGAAPEADAATPSDLPTVAEMASPTSDATAGPSPIPPTADPTVVALAASFTFPRLGDEAAPLTIYEFTDYL